MKVDKICQKKKKNVEDIKKYEHICAMKEMHDFFKYPGIKTIMKTKISM